MPANISNRLCNASPFQVKWDLGKGVVLTLEPDGYLDLERHIMEDFISTNPGYEAVKSQMDQYGVFLRDPTRPYEHQAIEALESYVKIWNAIHRDAVNNMRRRAASQGVLDEKAFAETLNQLGYDALMTKVEKVKKRLVHYKKRVEDEVVVHEEYDPERTILCMDPPKQFESKIAMQVFLEENLEIKKRHEAYLRAEANARKPKTAPRNVEKAEEDATD